MQDSEIAAVVRRERWESLTPEERERLREKYARHCRWQGSEPASENPQL